VRLPTTKEYRVLLRRDFYTFVERSFLELNPETKFLHNWHIEKIAEELEKCRQGETKRLIVNVPPRSLKSHAGSVALPAWLLGHNPSEKIITVSYGQDLAEKHAADCRRVMMSNWYQAAFPATRLASSRPPVNDFDTTRNGYRLSASVGGPLTGRGADFIIIDDPLKPDEALSETQRKNVNDWYDHTLLSRLNNKETGCIIVIMQRLHEDDLVGHVLRHGGWKLLRFPAIAEEEEAHAIAMPTGQPRTISRYAGEALHPERESLETLQKIRGIVGAFNFSGQYQQAPAPFGGGMVKLAWFKTYSDLPEFDYVFQSWDTANKAAELNDYSVCTTWGVHRKALYLLHVLRKRLEYPDLKRAVREQASHWTPRNILIEDKASGTQLIQDLISESAHEVTAYDPKQFDKIMRMGTVTPMLENGVVHLPEAAEWLNDYTHELAMFPNGKYDDQADSTSQALDWYKEKSRMPGIIQYYMEECNKMRAEQGLPPYESTAW
jgi:predicted phage terminase large subunit-like protein